MTRFQFKRRETQSQPWSRRVGLLWLCLWLSVATGFGYRYLTQETAGEVQASIEVAKHAVAPPKTKPIEQIQVGERVAFTINPGESLDKSLGMDVDPKTWRKMTLRTESGSHEIVLLRPESWIKQHQADSKSTVTLAIPEIGVDELLDVLSIEPCPAILPGDGRIVISTFTHVAPETICMYLGGLDEPIRCTPNHITWSVEDRDFVEAHKLQAGNRVLCDDGVREIVRIEKISEPVRVFNLEVQGQHVYQVSSLGMLVHNASPTWQTVSVHTERATRRGARISGISIQEIQTNTATGVRRVIHTVLDDAGRVVDGPHSRPFYKPRIGTDIGP